MKNICSVLIILLLLNCTSYKNSLVGQWELIRIYSGDDSYLPSSQHKFQNVKSDRKITLEKDGIFSSNSNLCRDGNNIKTPSNGKYYMEKRNKADSIFTLESVQCAGIGSNLHIKLKNGKLRVDYASIGYYYEIYERTLNYH